MAGTLRLTESDYQRIVGRGNVAPECATVHTPAERAFIARLEQRKARGEVLDWRYRPCTLPLDSVQYTPRFGVWERDGFVFVELRETVPPLALDPEMQARVAALRWPEYVWLCFARKGKGFVRVVWWPEGDNNNEEVMYE